MDRGYNDYKQFMWLTQRRAKFVTHIKDNTQITRLKDDIIEEKDSCQKAFKNSTDKASEVSTGGILK